MADRALPHNPWGERMQGVPTGTQYGDWSQPGGMERAGRVSLAEEVEVIKSRRNLAKDHTSKLRAEQDEDYGFYDLEYTFKMPKDAEKVTYPGPRSDVDTIVDHLIPDLILAKVGPAKSGVRTAQEKADAMEHLINGLWYAADLQAQNYDAPSPVRAACKDGVIAGEFCFEVLPQDYLWGDEPPKSNKVEHALWEIKKADISPVYIGVCDPREVFVSPTRPITYAIKEYQRQTIDIVAQLKAWEENGVEVHWPDDLQGKEMWQSNSTRLWTEYYGEGVFGKFEGKQVKCFMVNNQAVVGPLENPLGFIPLVKRSIGYGRGGPNTPPEKRIWGVIRTVRSFYEAIGRRMTQVDSMIEHFAWGTWVAKGDAQKMDIHLGPNEVSYIPGDPDTDLTPQYPPPVVVEPIMQELESLRSIAGWATAPQVLQGQAQKGSQAAYHYVLQLQEARMRLVSLKKSLELAMAEVSRYALIILMHQGEPVSLRSITATGDQKHDTIKAEDIDPTLSIHIDLQQETPEENDRRIAIGQRLKQDGSISDFTFQEKYLKNPDWMEEFKKKRLEAFLNDPITVSHFNEGVAQEYDRKLYDKFLAAKMQLQNVVGQPPPVPGQPTAMDPTAMGGAPPGIGPGGAMPGSLNALDQEQAALGQMVPQAPQGVM